jgi:hypothetical protein
LCLLATPSFAGVPALPGAESFGRLAAGSRALGVGLGPLLRPADADSTESTSAGNLCDTDISAIEAQNKVKISDAIRNYAIVLRKAHYFNWFIFDKLIGVRSYDAGRSTLRAG